MVDLPGHCRIGDYEKLMEYGFTVSTHIPVKTGQHRRRFDFRHSG